MNKENQLKNLSINEIKQYIPYRYPFLLIDGVVEVVPGVSAKGYKNVTVNEEYFQGHFPGSPLMPGMIQIEALLQMLSMTVLTLKENRGKSIRCISANRIKLKERVIPGSKLCIDTELSEWNGEFGKGKGKGIVDGKEACSAEFEFTLAE